MVNESVYITKFDRLAQSAKYMKTGPNWVFSLFPVVTLLKAQAAMIHTALFQ